MYAVATTDTNTKSATRFTRKTMCASVDCVCFEIMSKFTSTHRHHQFIEITLNNHLIKKHETPTICELKTAKYYAHTHTHVKLSLQFEICVS